MIENKKGSGNFEDSFKKALKVMGGGEDDMLNTKITF